MDSSGVARWLSVYSLAPLASLFAIASLNRAIPRRDALLRWYERTQLARYKLAVHTVGSDTSSDCVVGTLGMTEPPPVELSPSTDNLPTPRRVASDRRREYDIVCDGLEVAVAQGPRVRIPRGQHVRCSGFDDLVFGPIAATERGNHANPDASFVASLAHDREVWILDVDLRETPTAFRGRDVVELPVRQAPYVLRGVGPEAAHKGVRSPWRWLYAWALATAGVGVAWPGSAAWWGLLAVLVVVLLERARFLSTLELPAEAASLARDADLARLDEPEVSVTIGEIEGPLWLYRLGQPHWLLPEKRATATEVFVFDFSDPHAGDPLDPRDAIVGAAAQYVSDAVSVGTDARASTMIPLVVGSRRIRQTHQAFDFAAMARTIAAHSGRQIIVWGAARDELDRGYVVHVRATSAPGDQETTFQGPLPIVTESVLSHLESMGDLSRTAPRAGFEAPSPADWALAADVIELVLVQVLSSDRAQALPPIDVDTHDAAVRFARALAETVSSHVPFQLLRWVAAIYAHRAKPLPPDQRSALVALVHDAPAESPLGRIAPIVLQRLGAIDDARATRDARLSLADGAYRAWLASCLEDD